MTAFPGGLVFQRRWDVPDDPCWTDKTCPGVWELGDGQFAVGGEDQTRRLRPLLPPQLGRISASERIIVLPRRVFLTAVTAVSRHLDM